jgi:hypothetical protein
MAALDDHRVTRMNTQRFSDIVGHDYLTFGETIAFTVIPYYFCHPLANKRHSAGMPYTTNSNSCRCGNRPISKPRPKKRPMDSRPFSP